MRNTAPSDRGAAAEQESPAATAESGANETVNGRPRGWSLAARLAALLAWVIVCGVGLGIAAVVRRDPGGWAAVLLAAMISGGSAATALILTVLLAARGDLVAGLLAAVACRTLVPLAAGVAMTWAAPSPAMDAAFGWLVAMYLLVLGVEVALSLPAVE